MDDLAMRGAIRITTAFSPVKWRGQMATTVLAVSSSMSKPLKTVRRSLGTTIHPAEAGVNEN
jgi:hypothetical protein